MTTLAVTADLLHHLVTGSHAEGVTALAVQAAIGHDTGVLLVADHGADFIDHTWQLPGGTVLPGQSLTDALHPVVATIGMSITEVTGYLGHHDDHTGQEVTRTFCFTVTVTDPDAICRSAIIGHRWACLDDLPSLLGLPNQAAWPLAQPAAPTPAAQEPQLSEPLRTWARGIYSDEAAVELLIAHAAFLNRSDFIDRCVVPKANHADNQTAASIDWSAAITTLDTGGLPCSRSEERILRLAASLGNGLPVNLRDATTDLDTRNAALLSQAILHATGHRPPAAAPNPLTPKRFR
jgi:ADP-ribose pyrophosphatase YjhB (NUDIX family)